MTVTPDPKRIRDREIAYAKVNLALHVRSRRDDGYHELETLFAFVDAGDTLNVHALNRLTLDIEGPFGFLLGEDTDNLVSKAALALMARVNASAGGAIMLTKNLPVASGIGGGSADAAATLRLLNRFWGCKLSDADLQEISAPLGADVPVCIASTAAVGRGIGQDLEKIDFTSLRDKHILLVNPGIPLATADVFEGWDGVDRGPLPDGDALAMLENGRNDLEASAIRLCPEISDVLTALRDENALAARMSGSGATCFGIFDSFTSMLFAEQKIKRINSAWWTMGGKLR